MSPPDRWTPPTPRPASTCCWPPARSWEPRSSWSPTTFPWPPGWTGKWPFATGSSMLRYVWREVVRNPRRTLASLVGVTLGVGLFSGVLFFIDGSGASMTKRAIAPLALDMQRVLPSPLGTDLRFTESLAGKRVRLTVVNQGAVPANEVVVNDEPPPPLTYVNGSTRL